MGDMVITSPLIIGMLIVIRCAKNIAEQTLAHSARTRAFLRNVNGVVAPSEFDACM